MIILALFFFLSIFFSFLCSIWEAVLLSITPSYVHREVATGSSLGHRLQEYKEDIDRPLSAILTLNTIAHTVGAIGVGAKAGELYGDSSLSFLGLNISIESILAGLMTLFILILSEIIPKTIGANMWRSLVSFTIRSIGILMFILAPLVWLSQLITKSLKNEKDKSVLSRADFAVMAKVSELSGTLDQSESKIITNLLHLNSYEVRDIMTPRSVVEIAKGSMTVRQYYEILKRIPYSRIPIYGDRQDDITGMVLKDDILSMLAEDKDEVLLSELSRPIVWVTDRMSVQQLFDKLVREKIHIVYVTDDYGSLMGLVTMEDLLETIMGFEITDETDVVADLQGLARKKWEAKNKKIEKGS